MVFFCPLTWCRELELFNYFIKAWRKRIIGGILTLCLRPVSSQLKPFRVYCSESLFVTSELGTASQRDEKAKAREARHFQLADIMACWENLFSASRSSECQTSLEVFTTAHCIWNKLIWRESAEINCSWYMLKIGNFQAKCYNNVALFYWVSRQWPNSAALQDLWDSRWTIKLS